MNAGQALAVVNRLAFVVQRMRSMAFEEIGDDEVSRAVLADLQPWVYGSKSILPTLAKLQDRGSVTPGELYNLCFIAHNLEPGIAISADIMKVAWGGWEKDSTVAVPEPDIRWNQGWAE